MPRTANFDNRTSYLTCSRRDGQLTRLSTSGLIAFLTWPRISLRVIWRMVSGILLALRCDAYRGEFRWVRTGTRGRSGIRRRDGFRAGSGRVGSSSRSCLSYAHPRHWETAPLALYGHGGRIRLAGGAVAAPGSARWAAQ